MLTCCSAMCYNVSMNALDTDPDEEVGSSPSAKELLAFVLIVVALAALLALFGVDVSKSKLPWE